MHILFLNAIFSGCLALIVSSTTRDLVIRYYHVTADFGVKLSDPSYETTAPLIVIDPELGCDLINNGADLEGAIVLVRRGQCQFFEKALNVASYGGVGLVVGNNAGNSDLLEMHKETQENRDVDIPCVFISENDYDDVFEELSEVPAGSVFATISDSEEYPLDGFWSTPNLTKIVTYMLIICPSIWAALLALQFCCRFIAQRRQAKRQTRVIPEVVFSSELVGEKQPNSKHLTNISCPICLENFEERTKIKLLPCDHGFHKDCIEPWIAANNDSCPICRQTVLDKLEAVKRENTCCCWRPRIGGYTQHLLSSNSELEEDETVVVSLQVQNENVESPNQPMSIAVEEPTDRDLFLSQTAEVNAAELSDGPLEHVTYRSVTVLQTTSDK
jgi:E3 ubiquitin-protein ligase RNF13